MYKLKIMYIHITILIFFLLSIEKPKETLLDENIFKTELQESVLEFVNDMDLNPDSCYMPYK